MSGIFLKSGAHNTLAEGGCAMEFAAFVAGEEHSDHPKCVSPVIGAFVRPINDRLPDDLRQRLIPVVLDSIGTATGTDDDTVRRWMAVDWAIRTALPWWLRNAVLEEWAVRVEAVDPIVDRPTASAAREVVLKAKGAANKKYAADASAAAAAAAAAYAAAAAADAAAAAAADAAAAYAAYAAADAAYAADARRKFWEANLDSCLELIHRMCAVGRKVEVEMVAERVAVLR